jgi:hypothetical protein
VHIISGTTPSDVYLKALRSIIESPDTIKSAPRGQPIREFIPATAIMTTPDSSPIRTADPDRNETIARYTLKEFELYDRGERRASEFAKAAKFWANLANPDGTINSAYGWLIFHDKSCGNPEHEHALYEPGHAARAASVMRTPWEWARESLKMDRDTRQAMVKLHKRQHLWMGNRDQVCTAYLIFHIRNGKLTMTVHMRSQDLVLGAVYDWPYFSSLQIRMLEELKPVYPDVTLGRYVHVMDSMHVYERNAEMVLKMINA